MDAPPVQYVTTSDGYSIAYADVGKGWPLVVTPQAWTNLQYAWTRSDMQGWLRLLASRFRLVQMDWRGQGMSSRGLRPDHKLDDMLLDIEAVVDTLALQRFVLLGMAAHAHIGIRYAARHPERVAALILLGSAARIDAWPPGIYGELLQENWDLFLRLAVPSALSGEQMRLTIERMRRTIDQNDFILRTKALQESRLDEILPLITAPTLVLHHRNNKVPSVEHGMQLAASIPQSRLVVLEGEDLFDDAEVAVNALEGFVTQHLAAAQSTSKWESADPSEASLSQREIEVLRLLAAGHSNQEIADELVISVNTVRRHASNIYDKTGVANRAQAAVYAKDHGLA
jgi:pimeloyl-ACP methyl ester carboxylesterase/DNA-binding CsgD family transcriptional regulator